MFKLMLLIGWLCARLADGCAPKSILISHLFNIHGGVLDVRSDDARRDDGNHGVRGDRDVGQICGMERLLLQVLEFLSQPGILLLCTIEKKTQKHRDQNYVTFGNVLKLNVKILILKK